MRNFQDTFETRKRSFIGAFSICMAVPSNIEFSLLTFILLILKNLEAAICMIKEQKYGPIIKTVSKLN